MAMCRGMLTVFGRQAIKVEYIAVSTMSEEQLSALLAKLKEDAVLQEKLKGATHLDAAVAMAQEAGFDVSKEDWLSYQSKQAMEVIELSDKDLEGVTGGTEGKNNNRQFA